MRPNAPPSEIRAAWVALIREAHPDAVVDGDADALDAATARAAELNAAYATLGGGQRAALPASPTSPPDDPFSWEAAPFFDPAAYVPFVDPFAVGVDPMAWRELQALARGEVGVPGGPAPSPVFDPEAALAAARLRVPPGGVAWLTPAQAAEVEGVMAGMEALSYDPAFASAVLSDLLARAAAVNGGGRPPAY